MPFEKGKSGNPNGRKKGVPNKDTEIIREAISDIVAGNIENIQKWLDDIAGDDPSKAMNLLLQLMEYKIPKLSRTEMKLDADVKGTTTVINLGEGKKDETTT